MKKTEKIEVRVSHEEKERLMELAEKRNQNISELIRDRMAGNYTVPAQTISRDIMWNRGMSAMALALASVAFIWGILGFMRAEPAPAPPVMSSFSLYGDESFQPVLKTQVAHRDGFTGTYSVKSEAGEFRTNLSVAETSAGVFKLTTNICRTKVSGCPVIDETVLILSQPSVYPSRGEATLFEGEDTLFKVITQGTPLPLLEKTS